MTSLEQAIKDAVEKGGYKYYGTKPLYYNPDGYWYIPDGDGDWRTLQIDNLLLDPSFWRALGKARGWENGIWYRDDEKIDGWQYHWYGLIAHLMAGKDVESFFATL